MLISRSHALFLESVTTGEVSHTSEFIAAELSRVIVDLHSRGVAICGTVADNNRANKKAWQILKFKDPQMHFHGCASRGLHLLVKDIFGATMAKRAGPVADFPERYPFEYLLMFVQHCKNNVSFFLTIMWKKQS
jgi:hypothetical protein